MLSNEILLLKIIKYGGKLSFLRSRGLTYSQIAMLIKKQEDERNVLITDDNIILTPQGDQLLNNSISKIIPREKDQWIVPQEHLYVSPISFDKIILPKGKKL